MVKTTIAINKHRSNQNISTFSYYLKYIKTSKYRARWQWNISCKTSLSLHEWYYNTTVAVLSSTVPQENSCWSMTWWTAHSHQLQSLMFKWWGSATFTATLCGTQIVGYYSYFLPYLDPIVYFLPPVPNQGGISSFKYLIFLI